MGLTVGSERSLDAMDSLPAEVAPLSSTRDKIQRGSHSLAASKSLEAS